MSTHVSGRVVMRQKWRSLLFLHWPVDPQAVQPLLPSGLEVECFNNLAYVGLVCFTMRGIRPLGCPAVRGLSAFHETNVRTYVRYQNRDPGVWFFSLDAANRLAVRLARKWFHLPYYDARMFLEREHSSAVGETSSILYSAVRRWPGFDRASYQIRAQPTGPIAPARPETLDHFLIERYRLYAKTPRALCSGMVRHPPYLVQVAEVPLLEESLIAAAGLRRPPVPPIAHYSGGVDVDVFRLQHVG
mgnify:CR=1 FL=1